MTVATIVEDVGLATSNSFGSLAEADQYFDNHPQAAVWDAGTVTTKTEALLRGAIMVNNFPFQGSPTNPIVGTNPAGTEQALQFPRISCPDVNGNVYDDGVIPTPLKHAQFETAQHMLGSNITSDSGLEPFSSVEVGPLKATLGSKNRGDRLPRVAWNLIRHMLQGGGQPSLVRG